MKIGKGRSAQETRETLQEALAVATADVERLRDELTEERIMRHQAEREAEDARTATNERLEATVRVLTRRLERAQQRIAELEIAQTEKETPQ